MFVSCFLLLDHLFFDNFDSLIFFSLSRMEGRKLNLYSPLPSIRRISSKTKHSSESDNKTTVITRPERRSCLRIEQETPVSVLPDQSFDHLSEPASVPFMWEQTQVLLMEPSPLTAAKAMAFTHQKRSSEQKQTLQNREALAIRQRSQVVAEHEHFAIVQSLYDDLNIDDDDDEDDEYDVDHRIYPEVTIKKACGFLPRLCAKNSFKISNPVPLVSGSNRGLYHSCEQTGLPNWSTRRLSGFISPYRTSCSAPEKPESFKRLNRGISKSQELYTPRTRRESLPNHSHSGEVRMFRNSISTPSRIQGTTIHDTRFLAEEVIRRRRSSNRSGNLLKTWPECTAAISTPPLPETPTRPWLRRTLLPPVSPRPYGVVLGQVGAKKLSQEILESTKWETMVKTSYVHNDHVRYSQELTVHPSRQKIT